MPYNSSHTGPQIDAAVELLGQIQNARESTKADRVEVKKLAGEVKANADQVATQAATVNDQAAQVSSNALAVATGRDEAVAAASAAEDSKDAAALSQAAAEQSQAAASASERSAAESQLAAGLSEQVSAGHAAEATAAAQQVAADKGAADESARSAARSAQNAEAVVTGGTASTNPSPGKIPLADAQGVIDKGWIPDDIARTADVEAAAKAASEALDAAAESRASLARFLFPSPEAPVVRDDGSPLQVGDRYTNTIDQSEYRYTDSGWQPNESLQAIAKLEAQVSVDPAPGAIPRSGDNGKFDIGWLPDEAARSEDLSSLEEEFQEYKTESDALLMATSTDQRIMYRRRILLKNLPNRPRYYDDILALGFTFLYPTAIAVDKSANQLIISYGTTGNSSIWAYWYIYDLSTGDLINCLRVEYNVNESIVIRYENGANYSESMFPGATRYAYTSLSYDLAAAGQSNLGRIDLTGAEQRAPLSELPVTFPVAGRTVFSWIDWTGEEWIAQHYGRSQGRFRRFLFDRFSPDFSSRVGTITTPFNFTGDTSGDNYLTSPKSQGFACLNGEMFTSIAAPFRPTGSAANNNPRAPGKQIGLACVDANGGNLRSALCQADDFIKCITPHLDFTPKQSETEGLSSNKGAIYNLWIGLSPNDPGANTRGLVLFEEMSSEPDAIDFSAYGTHHRGMFNDVAFQVRVHHDDSPLGLCHPITGAQFTSWAQICAAMVGTGVSTYRFVGTGQPMTDILGSPVNTAACVIEFTSVGGTVFYVEIFRNAGYEKWYISPSAGTQMRMGFTVGIALASLPNDQSAVVTNDNTLGKITTYKNTNAAATQIEFQNLSADGTQKQVCGYIRCSGQSTAYNTTSDATLKTHLGELSKETARKVLRLIRIHKFEFTGTGHAEYGPFAQELYEVYPWAVTPGFWTAVNPITGEENTCQECEVAQYTPWAVDKSKLMDVVVVAIQDLDERITFLEER